MAILTSQNFQTCSKALDWLLGKTYNWSLYDVKIPDLTENIFKNYVRLSKKKVRVEIRPHQLELILKVDQNLES